MSKWLEKLLLKRYLIFDKRFLMRALNHWCLWRKQICSAVFLWHENALEVVYWDYIIKYLGSFFRIMYEDEYSNLKETRARVPQGIVLGPVLYLFYTSGLPTLENICYWSSKRKVSKFFWQISWELNQLNWILFI